MSSFEAGSAQRVLQARPDQQGLPPGVPDPRYGRNGDRGQSSALDGADRSDSDTDQELQLECDLIAYISRSSSHSRSFEKDIQPRIAHLGLSPAESTLQEWLQQKSAVFEIDGDAVTLTTQSLQYDQHLESQFVTLLQRIGRPAHLGKDVASYCRKHNIDMQVQDRLVIWLKVKKQIFRVDKDYVTLQPSFLRKLNSGEFRPPGFPAHEQPAPVTNPWHARRRGEEQKMLHLEEKVLHWLASKDRVSTTEMAEFAYASHEELVPENWDANVFCQERAQLFKLSGDLHDQVELTETGRSLVENKPRAQQSLREQSARTAPPRNHQPAAHHESYPTDQEPSRSEPSTNHRPPSAQSSRDSLQLNQGPIDLQQENSKLKERIGVLETEMRSLRHDMSALQRHLNMPITLSAAASDSNSSTHYKRTKFQIFVLGGHNGSAWLDSVTTHKPKSNKWGRMPLLDSPRSFAAADTWRDNVYILGGGDGSQWFDTMLMCDTAQHSLRWVSAAPMKVERGSLAVTTLGDHVYAIGGGKPNVQYDSVERYDPVQDRWTGQPKLNQPRFALSAASAHGAVYAVGGFNGELYMSSVERYDPRVGRWEEQESEMLYPRGSLAVTALGDSVYAIGGFDSQEALSVVEVMDTRTMKWRSLANLSAERAYGEATIVNDQVYVVGGLQSNMTTYAPFLEVYDAELDQWEVLDLPADIEPRAFAAVCSL